EHGVKPEHLKEGVVPTIPRGALIPKDSKNLMVAGRCLSSDRLANSALRVQASCMAMGQAAGATTALAARTGTAPSQVPLPDIRRALAEHGAIVPRAQAGHS
ncbi:MAG: FAD-dependent oxidoreductase, partial [Verrucomicrobia bacterium]|nr:FAD-dependent oxidoreductase [Verrucomicrobiota bacterium]